VKNGMERMRKGAVVLICDTIPAFAWGTEESHENLNPDISEILNWNLVIAKQECYTVRFEEAGERQTKKERNKKMREKRKTRKEKKKA
jgi:hypothetical protein